MWSAWASARPGPWRPPGPARSPGGNSRRRRAARAARCAPALRWCAVPPCSRALALRSPVERVQRSSSLLTSRGASLASPDALMMTRPGRCPVGAALDRVVPDYDTVLFRIESRLAWLMTSDRRKWIVLSVLIVSLVAIVLDDTVLNIALKTISEPGVGLGASQSQLEWAINSYTLVFAGLLFTFGVVGDRVGRKRMLIIGMILFGLASLVSSYARSPDELIWARAAMGFGGAAVMPQTLSIVTNTFDAAERPRAIGIWASAVGVAIAIGPMTGGLLLTHYWWGSVFLINVPLTAIGVAAIVAFVPESKNPSPGRVDYVGVPLSTAGLGLLAYGISRASAVAS